MIQRTSLSQTLDAVNEAAFFLRKIAPSEAKATANWVAARHCVPGTYARMFGLFPDERASGIRLFTGERVTNAAARHIVGEEACRALLLLNANSPAAREALRDATADMLQRLGPADAAGPRPDDGQMHWLWPYRGGTYCCGACSVSLWRHITAGGLDDARRRLERGMECLKTCRKGDGTWRIFPFWRPAREMGPDRRAKQDHPIGQRESRSPAGVYKNTNVSDLRQLLGIFCFYRFAGLTEAVALAVAFQDVAAMG